jgi:hypothetical protein
MHQVSGTFLGRNVRVTWNDQTNRYDGDEFVWLAVVNAARDPLPLTPTGPTLERPNVHDESHALPLLASVMRVSRVVGIVPPPAFADDEPVPDDAVF